MKRKYEKEWVLRKVFQLSHLILISFSWLVLACGKQKSQKGEVEVISGSIIVGSLDWKEITSLSPRHQIRLRSRPVGDIDLPVLGSRCTGFLISENILMTNHHCVPTPGHARGVQAVFNHFSNVKKSDYKKYNCSTFIGHNKKYDFALLKCQGRPGLKYGFVTLSDEPARKGSNIYVVQQNCDYYLKPNCDWSKKYSKGLITKVKDKYSHNADTLGGSSGSPVFDSSSNEVIAIHHAGYGNNGMGRGYENYAIPMHKIVQFIHSYFPQVRLGGESDDNDSNNGEVILRKDFEPNNSLSKAVLVKLPFKENLKISNRSDKDYFKIITPNAGNLKVKIKFKHKEGDLDLRLINGLKKIINKSGSSSDNEFLSKKVSKGIYYVKVFGHKKAIAKYSIDISFESKSYNDEPNNSFQMASGITVPTQMNKVIETRRDLDYYTFKVSRKKKVTVLLKFSHKKGDLDLYLFNSQKVIINKSSSVKSTELLTHILNSGTYYVAVKGYKGAVGSYTLEFK